MTRKPIGVLALPGVVAALVASVWQLGLPPGTAFYGTVQTDAFSVFFHVLICSIVLVALLSRLRRVRRQQGDAGRVLRLVLSAPWACA